MRWRIGECDEGVEGCKEGKVEKMEELWDEGVKWKKVGMKMRGDGNGSDRAWASTGGAGRDKLKALGGQRKYCTSLHPRVARNSFCPSLGTHIPVFVPVSEMDTYLKQPEYTSNIVPMHAQKTSISNHARYYVI